MLASSRAGEHGRGFAIVAREVTNLAQQSSESATLIDALLDSSRDRVQAIIAETKNEIGGASSAVDGGRQVARKAEVVASRMSEIFAVVTAAISSISGQVLAIAKAAEEQQAGISQVTLSSAQLNEAAGETRQFARKNAELAQILKEMSVRLEALEAQMSAIVLGRHKIAGVG